MEIVPLVEGIRVIRCREIDVPVSSESATSNIRYIRYPVTKYTDNNTLEFKHKKLQMREFKEQPYCAMDVVFFYIANSENIRQVNSIDDEPELDLSNMGLRIISCLRSVNINFLCKLDLSHNKLIDQSLDFDIPPLLTDLDLSYNQISGDLSCMRDSHINKLNLSHNLLFTIPKDLPCLLSVLNLSYNYISKVDSHLPNSLSILNLSKNCIQEIPGTLLFSLKKLDILDLSNNYTLTNIPLIPEKHKLSSFDISGCGMIYKNNLTHLACKHQGLRLYI